MNKKGFTLIELLAVIAILAIITIIAVPIVLNVIEESKNGVGLRSAELYLKGVEMSVMQASLENKKIESKTYEIMSDGNICLGTIDAEGKCKDTDNIDDNEILKVEAKGTKPTSGTVTISNKNISSIELNYEDGKKIMKNSDGELLNVQKIDKVCELKSAKVENKISLGDKYECDFGDGKRNFYILELGSNKVEGSILKDDEVALILEGNYDTETLTWCAEGTANSCAADGLTSKLNDIAKKWKKLGTEQIVLPSIIQVATADGKEYKTKPNLTGTWLYNWDNPVWGNTVLGYWTSTPNGEGDYVWALNNAGKVVSVTTAANVAGVRPVVNLKI